MYTTPYNVTRTNHQSGFSLIEVLVSLALFTIVVTMSVGTLLVLIDANTKAQNMQSVMTNLGYALDSMTRDIRTGTYYECRGNSGNLNLSFASTNKTTNNCTNPGAGVSNSFAFRESGGSLTFPSGVIPPGQAGRIGYRLNNGTIERSITAGGNWQPITAPDITINTLQFIVTGAANTEDFAPTVTIFVEGVTKNGTAQTADHFELQTTVAQQSVDI